MLDSSLASFMLSNYLYDTLLYVGPILKARSNFCPGPEYGPLVMVVDSEVDVVLERATNDTSERIGSTSDWACNA